MVSQVNYFAYGSNLHPYRLKARISLTDQFHIAKLEGATLTFNKPADDGSAKANIRFTDNTDSIVYGVLYELPKDAWGEIRKLEVEKFGYKDINIEVITNSEKIAARTFFYDGVYCTHKVKPYTWYLNLILAGAKYHKFPKAYIKAIEDNITIVDINESRTKKTNRLLDQIGK
jgi:hypothetical protein